MRARADGDTLPVDHGGDVMRMCTIHLEGQDRAFLFRTPVDLHAVDPREFLSRVVEQHLLVRGDFSRVEGFHIVDRSPQPHGRDDCGRTRLELVRRLAISNRLFGYFADHLATAQERRQAVEPFALRVKRTDAGRTIELVTREDIEIAIEVLHVRREMHGALAAVHEHRNAARMRELHDLFHRHDGAERIRHLRDRDDLGALG